MTKLTWILSACLLCPALSGCSDDATEATSDAGAEGTDSAVGDKPDDNKPDENADKTLWTKGSADACDIKTDFIGDEYCIKPVDPKIGFQLHYGPKDYNDPDEVAKYVLMPGEEVTDCIITTTPNDKEIFHDEYHGRMRPGSHHMLIYTEDNSKRPESDGPVDCNQGVSSRNIFGSQTLTIDLVAGSTKAPEDEGIAQRLMPKQRAIMQMHFINTTDKPILREAWANIVYVDKSEVKIEADPIFFLAGVAANIKPGTVHVSKGKAVADTDLRLVQATGHFHAHTVRFSAWKTIGGKRELLFEDFDWHEPTMFQFNSVKKNGKPDMATGTKGAFSGIVNLKKGDMIDWECEVNNDSEKTLGFGNEVYGAEMCNMFGFYTPGAGEPWGATNL